MTVGTKIELTHRKLCSGFAECHDSVPQDIKKAACLDPVQQPMLHKLHECVQDSPRYLRFQEMRGPVLTGVPEMWGNRFLDATRKIGNLHVEQRRVADIADVALQ